MRITEDDIMYETEHFWVLRVPKGFEVMERGICASTRVARIGRGMLDRAIKEAERREATR